MLGLLAAIALIVYAVLLFALVKLIPITLTLPGIAGLILTLGVAADANIVVFERVKEEVRAGRSIPASIAAGYTKALRTIIDANVCTIGVAFILFMLATAGIKGFAFTLGVGTLTSLFTAVLFTSALMGSLSRTRLLNSRFALGAQGEGRPWTFDFMGKSKWFFSMSGVILLVGALAIAGQGASTSASTSSRARGSRPRSSRRRAPRTCATRCRATFRTPRSRRSRSRSSARTSFQISTETLEPDEVDSVRTALDEEFGVSQADFSANSIGPTFGEQIARTALIAVIASLLLISIYIGLRFEFKYSVPVLIALFHDILITAGVYALADREVTTSTVAALLTILGYSLYDTIIVFDRIRENVPRMPRAAFTQIVNRSMAEVLTRSLATSFCTLLPVAALMLFGGETLQRLRVRAARRHRLGRLLVDLHRVAGAERVEGARARLPPPAQDGDGGARRRRARVRHRCDRRRGAGRGSGSADARGGHSGAAAPRARAAAARPPRPRRRRRPRRHRPSRRRSRGPSRRRARDPSRPSRSRRGWRRRAARTEGETEPTATATARRRSARSRSGSDHGRSTGGASG